MDEERPRNQRHLGTIPVGREMRVCAEDVAEVLLSRTVGFGKYRMVRIGSVQMNLIGPIPQYTEAIDSRQDILLDSFILWPLIML